jgi:hypothetical protein
MQGMAAVEPGILELSVDALDADAQLHPPQRCLSTNTSQKNIRQHTLAISLRIVPTNARFTRSAAHRGHEAGEAGTQDSKTAQTRQAPSKHSRTRTQNKVARYPS